MLDIVIGAQFGDESKGRIVDHLCSTRGYDTCARVNGSDNAGHTVFLGGDRFAFNQIPVGAVHGMRCVITRGCMVDLGHLDIEIARVENAVRTHERSDSWTLFIDSRCHIKTQEHRVRDAMEEQSRSNPIGTTLSGNGPAYSDKYARSNRRLCDTDIRVYPNIYRRAIMVDTSLIGYDRCLVEGAHGVMLDIDHGTYPFVTSSACTPAAACHSMGISPRGVDRIIGVMKPYVTRVGAGAFPTEVEDTIASLLRERGREYGTNTRRPRRIGWLDLHALSYAVRVAGITEIAMCKVDVLDALEDIMVCVEYEGISLGYVPAKNRDYEAVRPKYERVLWRESGSSRLANMIERIVGVPVTMIADLESISPRQSLLY